MNHIGEKRKFETKQTILPQSELGLVFLMNMLKSLKSSNKQMKYPFNSIICTLLDRKDCTNALLWSKTTLTTGSVGGAGVDPPPWKMDSIFLGSLALSVPIYRYFLSNGGKWWSLKLWINFFI